MWMRIVPSKWSHFGDNFPQKSSFKGHFFGQMMRLYIRVKQALMNKGPHTEVVLKWSQEKCGKNRESRISSLQLNP